MKDEKRPPQYYYLWHLATIGILQTNEPLAKQARPKIDTTMWDEIKPDVPPSRIALIDVGCSRKHPNLNGNVSTGDSIDFTISRYGAKIKAQVEEPINKSPGLEDQQAAFVPAISNFGGLDIERLIPAIETSDDTTNLIAELRRICEELAGSQGVLLANDGNDERFGSHGTGMAGLMVGRSDRTDNSKPPEVPYFGVDPMSEVISIRASFEEEPIEFISAFIYAWHQKADVIVMPRTIPDPRRSGQLGTQASGNSGPYDIQRPKKSELHWRLLEKLIVAISKEIPIVCAAGNSGQTRLVYPADLASSDNGIIAVGAINGDGRRSGYASYGDNLTLCAPSDDAEILNKHQKRLSKFPRAEKRRPGDPKLEAPYAHTGLLTTDLLGNLGYDSGQYTLFGGTSGASAIVGGVVAILKRATDPESGEKLLHPDWREGVGMKALLQETAFKEDEMLNLPMRHGYLETDAMNAEDEVTKDFAYFFGAGVVNAERALVRGREAKG